jgi:oxygen-dependent protoporphyrinogen oxidase
LSGIYGGDPRELSVTAVLPRFVELAQKYGSLTRGVLASRAQAPKVHSPAPLFRTLRGGLGQMVDGVVASIQGKTEVRNARAHSVERTPSGFRLQLDGEWMEADHLVMACEAHSGAQLLKGVDARLAELMGMVAYSSSMTVAVGFDAADFARLPQGFGFLVPKKERRRLVACTWIGTKFPNRVPEGKVVARCFLGGAENSDVLSETDETITKAVLDELREIAGVTAPARFTRISRWPRSMAQATVGHPAREAELEARVARIPGLHIAGNAYQGIGIPDCIRMGKAAAEMILAGDRSGSGGA